MSVSGSRWLLATHHYITLLRTHVNVGIDEMQQLSSQPLLSNNKDHLIIWFVVLVSVATIAGLWQD